MKLKIAALALPLFMMAATEAHARKDTLTFKVADFMANSENSAPLEGVTFKWGAGAGGSGLIGPVESRRPANKVMKADEVACQRALLNVLLGMKEDAVARGGKTVGNLVSFATGADFSSATEYQCIVGATNARVYLKGNVYKN